jgi:hypothetical protein
MKHNSLTLILLAFMLFVGCQSNTGKVCLVIDDFDNTHYVFPLSHGYKINLGDFTFLKSLPVGFIVSSSALSITGRDKIPTIEAPNGARNPKVFGNSDKYYNMYLAHIDAASYSLHKSEINTVKLKIINEEYILRVENADVDSLCLSPVR